ncbi:hypothetical protein [Synechococcus phage Yong-M3-232]|nr:hypothetical protein [Synechococcus phage Yong-M3-232]
MTNFIHLFRAWACYWIMQSVDFILSPIPRSPAKARFINSLIGPFAPYGMFWALYTNPNLTAEQRKAMFMRKRDD